MPSFLWYPVMRLQYAMLMYECALYGWENGPENGVLRLPLKSKRWALLNGRKGTAGRAQGARSLRPVCVSEAGRGVKGDFPSLPEGLCRVGLCSQAGDKVGD